MLAYRKEDRLQSGHLVFTITEDEDKGDRTVADYADAEPEVTE
jgi:hypothetical protein